MYRRGIIGMLVLCAGLAGAEDWLDGARTKLQAGQLPEAETALRQALGSHPGSLDAHLMLAFVESKLGRAEAAVREYRIAIRLAPQSFPAHYNLAMFFLSQSRPALALPELRRAAALEPASSDALFNLGVVLIDRHQADEALPYLLHARQLQPDRADVQFQIARAFAALHRYEEADEAAHAFLKTTGGDASAVGALAEAWLQSGRYDAALALLESTKTPSARFLRARALYHLGRSEEAAHDAELALAAEPSNAAVLLFLARLHQRKGEWASAKELLDRAMRSAPDWFEPCYSRAVGLYAEQRYDEAVADLNASIRLNPACARCVFLKGVILFNQGRLPGAEISLRRALQLEPDNARFRAHLAEVLLKTARLSDAEQLLRKAITLSPRYGLPHYELGKLLFTEDRLQAAAAEFESAAKIDPALTQALYRLGQTYARLGKQSEADRAFAEFRRRKTGEQDETLQSDVKSVLVPPN